MGLTIQTLLSIIKEEVEKQLVDDYKGEHQAPDKSDAPLHNLVPTYPEDIYSPQGVRLYGGGDSESIYLVQKFRNKPNALIRIYRTVPKILSTEDKINDLLKIKRYILQYGKTPNSVNTSLNASKYYDYANNEIEKLESDPNKNIKPVKLKIEPGNWVTISKSYAIEHGKSNLNGKYKLLSKVVKVSTLYTDGNSISEWGWNP